METQLNKLVLFLCLQVFSIIKNGKVPPLLGQWLFPFHVKPKLSTCEILSLLFLFFYFICCSYHFVFNPWTHFASKLIFLPSFRSWKSYRCSATDSHIISSFYGKSSRKKLNFSFFVAQSWMGISSFSIDAVLIGQIYLFCSARCSLIFASRHHLVIGNWKLETLHM